MSRRSVRGKAYKKTTTKQYNVMIRDIGHHLSDNPSSKSKGEHYLFWCELRDKLNGLGPPTRNITEWKKVWNDCQRSRKRREHFRMSLKQPKKEPIEQEEEEEEDAEEEDETNYNEGDEFQMESSQHSLDASMHLDDSVSSYTIYTPPASNHHHQQPQPMNHESFIHKQLPPLYRCPTLSYSATAHVPQPQITPNDFVGTPMSTNSNVNQEIVHILKNQMEHQTKLLEHMSQVSNNMALLMERQVTAIERQTAAVRRQAIAMEHHTLVMNSFVDMIRDKMPKSNNNKTTNSSNGKL